MKQFDKDYKMLEEMYQDEYFPDFLVDKVKDAMLNAVAFLETGETNLEKIQKKFIRQYWQI